MLFVALLGGVTACHTQARTSPALCNPGGDEYPLRLIDGRCRLVNEWGYHLGRVRTRPDWHDHDTGAARQRDPAHPVRCDSRNCIEIELTFPTWVNDDEPDLQLALNPNLIWVHTYFPVRCERTSAGMVCRTRMHNGGTTIVTIPRYSFQRGADGRLVASDAVVRGRYRDTPICVSRIGIDLYAIQVPLIDTTGEVIGSSHTWCQTFLPP
jgi:hypothetical protein